MQNSFYPRGYFVTRRSGWFIEIYDAFLKQLVYGPLLRNRIRHRLSTFPERIHGLRDDSDDGVLVPVRCIYDKIIDVKVRHVDIIKRVISRGLAAVTQACFVQSGRLPLAFSSRYSLCSYF
jgi:hypothetical protein